jgi:hypothetical protein
LWAGAFLDWLAKERDPSASGKLSLKPRAPGE